MQKIKVELLKVHPRNKEFFDDMEGDKWKDFVESIKTSGIIQPLIVTDDYIVISGHQRLKAAKELGLAEVPCEVHEYTDKDGITAEDWKLKDLLESNLMQRGIGNINPMKSARCIGELKRIYDVRKGNNQYLGGGSATVAVPPKTEKELADNLGISERHLRELNQLNNLIPPFQKLIEFGSGENSLSLRLAIFLASRSKEEQEELYRTFGDTIGKYKKAEIEQYQKDMEEMRKKMSDMQNLTRSLTQQKQELEKQKTELEQKLKNIKPEVIEKVPDDYQDLKDTLRTIKEQSKHVEERLKEVENERQKLEREKQEYLKALEDLKTKNKKLEKENSELLSELRSYDQAQLEMKYNFELSSEIADLAGIINQRIEKIDTLINSKGDLQDKNVEILVQRLTDSLNKALEKVNKWSFNKGVMDVEYRIVNN
ncbi:ParB/RepB/Spo0J family partition protein [Thermoanaerobacterium thermosaccharolyticum]|uniref:ParB/RepB/Spo0J family partition protein n=1 Tax=Thermoanaerobacterium thermosaccharolyticum TaxID=1517 RepID=UPI0017815DAB|nr:ParB N-terminal domain-containing protein [Thermoanaerobacterium thermosaccharolyticum]MBE0069847.1 chromosome partitioning protein ParB [Thermoanaerobacterium thermosaccharolyticum]MBE0227488.1 chromosome partitioning protein ParB [Thermoanaerobacterium thermosaccharolyticum]